MCVHTEDLEGQFKLKLDHHVTFSLRTQTTVSLFQNFNVAFTHQLRSLSFGS